jgi:hypothetical protein
MSTPYSGGCACGLIRYKCSAAPVMSVNYHCRDCQRASGSAYAADIVLSKFAWQLLSGTPKYFEKNAASGNTVKRGFCGDFGSPLFVTEDVAPDIITINVGSLDDPSWYTPTCDWWTKSAQPWDHMNPSIEKLDAQP